MKAAIVLSLLLAACGVRVHVEPAPLTAAAPRCIAVLPFANSSEQPHAGEVVATLVADTLLTHGYGVLEPSAVAQRLAELQLAATSDTATLQKLGAALGVDAILTGSVTRYEAKSPRNDSNVAVAFSGRLLQVAPPKVVWANSVSANLQPYLLAVPHSRLHVAQAAVDASMAELIRNRPLAQRLTPPCWKAATQPTEKDE